MKKFYGKSINKGIGIGEIFFLKQNKMDIKREKINDVNLEIAKYEESKIKSDMQLSQLYEKMVNTVGEEEAAIIEVQQMFLIDEEYNELIINKIKEESINAEYSAYLAGETFANMFLAMDSDYMKGRAIDIRDLTNRICKNILNIEEQVLPDKPVIIAAEELTPSETAMFKKEYILGIVTKLGTESSHTAILTRNMDIPSVISEDVGEFMHGEEAIVDAINGEIYLNPSNETSEKYKAIKKEVTDKKEKLKLLKGKKDITKDGKEIKLYSNIGRVEDVDAVLENDSKGIGLFRSEFLYMGRNDYPTEEEQYKAYSEVLKKMQNKPVIIRTLDIGADKKADYFEIEEEENPALGFRAIRICLSRTDIFKTQLRALYRASVHGNLLIMFPMIISLEEIKQCKLIIEEVKEELRKENIEFKEVSIGIMIETPASVMLSDELAKEVDFFSVGTNDLTQYTLAVDRQNKTISSMFSAKHDAVLKMLQIIVDNAHKNNIWAGICGEIASDPEMTSTFLKMGYDELSVSAAKTLEVREEILNLDLTDC